VRLYIEQVAVVQRVGFDLVDDNLVAHEFLFDEQLEFET
jgi:hypothetical protein